MTSSLHLKARLSDSALFLRVLTLGELRKGMDGAADPARRMALSDGLETAKNRYLTPIFPGTNRSRKLLKQP